VIRVLLSAPFCLQVWPSSLFTCRPESWDRALVKFKQRRIRLDLPKGTYIVVLREGQDYLFYLGEQVVFRMTGQEKCHPCI
jgi:hypothetical protein